MAILYVPSGLYPLIQDAMTAAANNDVVEIADGTYTENNLRFAAARTGVTIRAAAGADVKIHAHALATNHAVFNFGPYPLSANISIENIELRAKTNQYCVAGGINGAVHLRRVRVPATNTGNFFDAANSVGSTVDKCVVLGGVTGINRNGGSGLLVTNSIVRVSGRALNTLHLTDGAINCLFIKTSATSTGRCVEMLNPGTLVNCVAYKEGAAGTSVGIHLGNAAAAVSYCCAYGFATNFDEVAAAVGAGCIEADPLFVDPGAYDYHSTRPALPATNPIIDAGTTVVTVIDDLDGTPRPQGSAYDMGPYESAEIDPPVIVHVPIADGVITGTATNVDATITDASGVGSATLYHRLSGAGAWSAVPMVNIGGDVYRGTIPGAAIPEGAVEYYIEAEDTLAPPNVGTDPAGAPGVYYLFGAAPLTAMGSVEVMGHNRLRVTFTEKFGPASVFDKAGWSVLRRSGPTPETVVGVAITGTKTVEVYVNGGIVAPMSYTVACPGAVNPFGLPATLTILAFTVTPSMVATVFASAALADQFEAMPAEIDVPDCLIYPMLPEGLRTIDQSHGALLERLLWGPETEWAAFMQRAWRLRHLSNYKVVPGQLLDYLLALVGFGDGEPGRLARLLTEADKRRLVSVAARYWKRRGRLDALSDAIRVFASGIRPAIDPYPVLRFIVDEVEMGMTGHPGLDPWMLALPTAMDTVYLRVPDLGSLDRGVVESLARLARPMGEVYEIAYVDFLDAFTDGIQGHWEKRGGVVTAWREPYLSPDPLATPHRLPGLRLLAGCAERVAVPLGPTWAEYLWGAYVEWEGTGNDATLALRFYVTDDDNRYEVRFLPAGAVQFYRRVAGVDALILATAIPPGLDGQHGIRIETEVNLAGNNEVRVYLDGALVLLDDTDNAHSAGAVEVAVTAGTGAVVFSRTELYQLPLATTTLTG